MSAPSYIRRHINNLVGDKPFSIRDFLIYGRRNTVDQVFYRLVKSGRIIRVARGMFIKCTSPMPSVMEVATAKAAAFGKTIVTHGSHVAGRFTDKMKDGRKYVFASSGGTSSFRFGEGVIYFVRTSARKMKLGDSPEGLIIRALWYLGKRVCNVGTASAALESFRGRDHRKLRLSAAFMPAWMRECFASFGRMDCIRRDLEAITPT